MSAELNARRTAAAAVLADYERAVNESARTPAWPYWAQRLAIALTDVLAPLDAEAGPAPGGGAYLAPAELCDEHGADLDAAAACRLVAARLGSDHAALACAFPEWDITAGPSGWQARLTTSQSRPQPQVTASTAAQMTEAINAREAGDR